MSVAVVVDDILISTSNESEINLYVAFLQQKMIRPFSSVFHKTSEAQLSMVPGYGETNVSAEMELEETVEGSRQGSKKFGE